MPTTLTPEQEAAAISLIRGFAMDAPLQAKSGHQGTAMALAPLAHVLFNRVMRHDPVNPHWPDRDRFILSNGHVSILQYSMLYLCGYGLELDDIKAFRQWGSLTPGHPEAELTTGIEVTTGPLGQGFGNAVGMAIAERRLRTQFGDDVMNHHIFVIAGDGCFEEGISHEAASLAGHQRLDIARLQIVRVAGQSTADVLQRRPRQDRHAVEALLPVRRDVVAERLYCSGREALVDRFDLLQAHDVRFAGRQPSLELRDTGLHTIDVPGGDAHETSAGTCLA